ncbi:unnamed protein product, partial [Closterium sp. NIES-64]
RSEGVDGVEGAARPDLRCCNIDAGEELSALRLSEGEPVQPVLDKLRDLYAKLATAESPTRSKQVLEDALAAAGIVASIYERIEPAAEPELVDARVGATKILEEDFRRRQLRGGDDGSSGYGMQGSRRGKGRGFGGAGRGAKKDDDSNDQQGGTGWGRGAKSGRGGKSGAGGKMKGSCWYCEKEGHPGFCAIRNPMDGPPRIVTRMAAREDQKNGANMVADSSDNNPKGNGGAEKKKERTAGQFFHMWRQGGARRTPMLRSMWQLPALAWHGGGQAGEGSCIPGECNAVGGVGVKVSARSGETDWATAHRRLGHVAMPLLKQLEKDGAEQKAVGAGSTWTWWGRCRCKGTRGERLFLTIVE